MAQRIELQAEWIESDGLGGFAMGTAGGFRTRRYHGLLAPALSPPTGRHVLLDGFDAALTTSSGTHPLSTQCYADGLLAPAGWESLERFDAEPWPTWTFVLADGTRVVQELFAVDGAPIVVVGWRLDGPRRARRAGPRRRNGPQAGTATEPCLLRVRPLLSGRDHHELHQPNDALSFATEERAAPAGESRLRWQPYSALPAVTSLANGRWRSEPHWYHRFHLAEEAARGFPAELALAAPGELEFDLARGPAWWVIGQELAVLRKARGGQVTARAISPIESRWHAAAFAEEARAEEKARRRRLADASTRAATQFLARRGAGRTLLAGFPWFTDWGRDTAIAARGLLIATGRLGEARDVLRTWAAAQVGGRIPNRFPDRGAPPEFGAADAPLWFIVAVEELLAADRRARPAKRVVDKAARTVLLDACRAILAAHAGGKVAEARVDADALLAVGDPAATDTAGVAPTWMDARVDGRAVTARVGKPVEIEALWWNALAFGAAALPDAARWRKLANRARRSFLVRFLDDDHGELDDVIDVDHVPGTRDPAFRPNQLFALGGLPRVLVSGPRARAIVDAIALRLWTPRGVRTLAPDDPRYRGRCVGGPRERDGAYHEGTAWPWLLWPLADAWARSRGNGKAARRSAWERFIAPLETELAARSESAHVAEIADGDAPHTWRGCPMQAWSLAALLQAEALLR